MLGRFWNILLESFFRFLSQTKPKQAQTHCSKIELTMIPSSIGLTIPQRRPSLPASSPLLLVRFEDEHDDSTSPDAEIIITSDQYNNNNNNKSLSLFIDNEMSFHLDDFTFSSINSTSTYDVDILDINKNINRDDSDGDDNVVVLRQKREDEEKQYAAIKTTTTKTAKSVRICLASRWDSNGSGHGSGSFSSTSREDSSSSSTESSSSNHIVESRQQFLCKPERRPSRTTPTTMMDPNLFKISSNSNDKNDSNNDHADADADDVDDYDDANSHECFCGRKKKQLKSALLKKKVFINMIKTVEEKGRQ